MLVVGKFHTRIAVREKESRLNTTTLLARFGGSTKPWAETHLPAANSTIRVRTNNNREAGLGHDTGPPHAHV